MSTQNLTENLDGLDYAVGLCIDGKKIMPALALLYAAFDIVASLERQPTEGTKAAFVRWVETYVNPTVTIGCTAVELYAARCGVLHTFGSESDLSKAGKARELTYAWGDANAAVLQAVATKLGHSDLVAVHVNDIRNGFRKGVDAWLSDVSGSSTRLQNVAGKAGKWYMRMSKEIVQQAADAKGGAG